MLTPIKCLAADSEFRHASPDCFEYDIMKSAVPHDSAAMYAENEIENSHASSFFLPLKIQVRNSRRPEQRKSITCPKILFRDVGLTLWSDLLQGISGLFASRRLGGTSPGEGMTPNVNVANQSSRHCGQLNMLL